MLVGRGKLIDSSKLAHVFVSPRNRAKQTFELAFSEEDRNALIEKGKVTETTKLAEWDYGIYEGLVTKEIRALRKKHRLDQERPWDIWRDGCEGGEYVVFSQFFVPFQFANINSFTLGQLKK